MLFEEWNATRGHFIRDLRDFDIMVSADPSGNTDQGVEHICESLGLLNPRAK